MADFDNQHRWRTVEMFSEARITLMLEIQDNPELVNIIAGKYTCEEEEWEIIVAETAAFCNVGLDGDYLPEDLEELYVELVKRLKNLKGYSFGGKKLILPLKKWEG